MDGLVQDCSKSSALSMELLHSCTKPSIHYIEELAMGTSPHGKHYKAFSIVIVSITTGISYALANSKIISHKINFRFILHNSRIVLPRNLAGSWPIEETRMLRTNM